jgi:biopolymer transport protein TolR
MTPRKLRNQRIISDLNITNLIDVMLVLLIIFMITAPMMTQGIQVDLPKADAQNVEVNEYIQVTINKKSEIFIDQERVSMIDFHKKFMRAFRGRTNVPVFFSGDQQVPYGLAMRVIAEIQSAGVVKLGFLTNPLDKKAGKS